MSEHDPQTFQEIEECMNVGEFDECGSLNNLTKQGLTDSQGFNEIFANSIDAFARRVHVEQKYDFIKVIDDGNGMDFNGIKNMASCNKENHSHEKAKGVAGVGAKAAFIKLSRKDTIIVYTKKKDGQLFKVVFPWKKIYYEGEYTGQVTIEKVTDNVEIANFNLERDEMDNNFQGTTIMLPYNDDVYNDLKCNLLPVNQRKEYSANYCSPTDRPGITFGREENTKITFNLTQDAVKGEVHKYDYMKGDGNRFYQRKSVIEIEAWLANDIASTKPNMRFIIRDEDGETPMEFPRRGAGYTKTIVNPAKGLTRYSRVGSYYQEISCRKTLELFDEDTGKRKYSGAKINLEFDKKDIHDTYDPFNLCHKVVRNNQLIGYIESDKKDSSARANAESRFEQENVQSYLTYEPISNQKDNVLDDYIGTQTNKNQLNTTEIKANFTRLLDYNRKKKSKEIMAYFTCIESEKRIAKEAEDARIAKEAEDAHIVQEAEDARIAKEAEDEHIAQEEQVNQPSEEPTQAEQVNGSSDNPIQLETTNLTSSSDDSSSSSEEDYSTSSESDIETTQLNDSNKEGINKYSAEQLLTPENFESENTDNDHFQDSSSAEESILNDTITEEINENMEYKNKCRNISAFLLALNSPNQEYKHKIDEFNEWVNQKKQEETNISFTHNAQ